MHQSDLTNVLLSVVERNGFIESVHRGKIALWGPDGLALALGDVEAPVFCRSALKPLQVLPLLEAGLDTRFALDARELAVMVGSHNGTALHVGAVRSLLAKGGLSEASLLCGPHAPTDKQAALDLSRSGAKPERVHNNCSGKHAGFLLLAQAQGLALDRYLDMDTPLQQMIVQSVAEMTSASHIDTAIDGCGAPTFRLPLAGLARAFWLLANPQNLAPARAAACRTLMKAVAAEPVYVAGRGRLCTALLEHFPKGSIYPKNGAEGVYAFGLSNGWGMAIKVDDGAERGYVPVVVSALQHLGLIDTVPEGLREFATPLVVNTQKKVVGQVMSRVAWK